MSIDRNGDQVFSVHVYTTYVSVGDSLKSPFLYRLPMEMLLVVRLRLKWRSSFPIHAYTPYMGVGDSLKPLFLYGLPMGKFLVVGLRPQWRSSLSRTWLYSVCKCGRQPKITISVRTSHGKVVRSRVKAGMAIKFFPYVPIQRM